MMRMAGMQPYFFPYLGYWQLIDAVDCFVLFDEAQYIKQGWVNRNRVLKPGGGWQYITVPVAKHSLATSIRDVQIAPNTDWQQKILRQLLFYRNRALYFFESFELIQSILKDTPELQIGALNCRIIMQLCAVLGIKTEIVVSSMHNFDYGTICTSDDWALTQAVHLGASELINPAAGVPLMDRQKFAANGVVIRALHPPEIRYDQVEGTFEPALSIIDVLMFNGIEGTKRLLPIRNIDGGGE